MHSETTKIINITALAQAHQLMRLDKPRHPLFSVVRFETMPRLENETRVRLVTDLYQITLKRDCPGKFQYGQTMFDFDEGVMSFFAPKQVSVLEPGPFVARSGWLLNIHPNFLRTYELSRKIKTYGFFEYAMNEALILSEEEEKTIDDIFRQMEKEYLMPIDKFSQDVLIASIDLLLTYCNRYYDRQFIVRKTVNHTLLERFEQELNDSFNNDTEKNKTPSVKSIADKLHISANYLSDMLRQLTGRSALHHIQDKIIEIAKERLSTTDLMISEIAYELGFEYPQSFNKLFKSKAHQSPSDFRRQYN